MIACGETSTRLRQAIASNDLSLVQRLLRSDPTYLYNPDFANKGNTSLHVAAEHGLCKLAEYLIGLGHDVVRNVDDIYRSSGKNQGISINADGQTPLHIAASNLHPPFVEMLCQKFPATINRPDKRGSTPLLLAAKAQARSMSSKAAKPSARAMEDTSTVEVLLAHGADVTWQDIEGNTVLHNACAYGNLKTIRVFIYAGADPLLPNHAGWNPSFYSLTKQAEIYFKNLVLEYNQRKADARRATEGQKDRSKDSVRLVPSEETSDNESTESEQFFEA